MIRIVMGLPGGGKSWLLAEVALKEQKRGRKVFSNFPIRGCYRLSVDDLRFADFPPKSVLLFDEAGAFFNSSDWDKLPLEVFILFSQSRHLQLDLWVAVQQPMRLAKPLRELGSEFYWCTSWLFGFGFRRYIYYDIEHLGMKGDDIPYKVSYKFWRDKRVGEAYNSWDLSLVGERQDRLPVPWFVDDFIVGDDKDS